MGFKYSDFPKQELYSMAATSRILAINISTVLRRLQVGTMTAVETPFGRMVHRSELLRCLGREAEIPDYPNTYDDRRNDTVTRPKKRKGAKKLEVANSDDGDLKKTG